MDHLPSLLVGLDAMEALVAQDFPEDCVPIRRNVRTSAFGRLPLPAN